MLLPTTIRSAWPAALIWRLAVSFPTSLIRYNVFLAGGTSSGLLIKKRAARSADSATFASSATSSVHLSRVECLGVKYDSNSFLSGVGSCGTNSTSLGAGDPFMQSSIATPNNSWSAVSLLNAHPDGSPALPTIGVVSGSDLDLDQDADGAPRSNVARPGAYS